MVQRKNNGEWIKVNDCGNFHDDEMETIKMYSHRAHFLKEIARNLSMTDDIEKVNSLITSITDEQAINLFGGKKNICEITKTKNSYTMQFNEKLPVV